MSFYAKSVTVDVTTDGSGDATVYSDNPVNGRLISVSYVKDGTTPFENTVDFTITGNSTAQSVLAVSNVTASTTYAPRQATCSVAGAASLYAAGGTAVNDHIVFADERIKIVVAQGGDTKLGRFIFVLG